MNEQHTSTYSASPSCGKRYFKDKAWKRLCLSCYLEAKDQRPTTPPRPTPTVALIDLVMLHRLIQLCHPDKHNGSEASNAATRFLLELGGQQ